MPLLPELAGCVERGLDEDLSRWFPDAPPVLISVPPRPVDPFTHGRLRLTAPTQAVMRAIRIVGTDAFIDCHKTLPRALAA
ncbi:hypothetical protein ACFVIY_40125 [Streptomyces sp. NPDC127166]|uniref:hypothetical protein n=1 Tax=Streptomyces sp. NPDC127166 TaxID=3345380 RepID=UPI0036390987